MALLIISWAAVLGGAATEVYLRFGVFSATEPASDSVFVMIGHFIGAAAVIGMFPYLISLAFHRKSRALPRMIALICFAVILVLLCYYVLADDAAVAAANAGIMVPAQP